MPPLATGRIKFDDFELDCDRYELLRAGRSLKLEKIPMELLILLVDKNGHLATRQEIVERLWGKDVFVDTEHGINTAVRKIRQTLRDDPEHPRFVQTVTGKGYRFIAATTAVGSGAPATALPAEPYADAATVDLEVHHLSPISPADVATRRSPAAPLRNAVVVVGLLVLVGLLLAWRFSWRDRPGTRATGNQIHSVAVLPLDNLSGDKGQDFFADGMTDELITMLAKNTSLRVVSRTSVMQYKGAHRPLREIAQELGVDGIVEGSVERSAQKVHMTVQLIQAPTDAHLWAESYDRNLNDAASLPQDLAQAIAQQLHSRPRKTDPQRFVNPEAHDAYLWGRYYWFAEETDTATKYFQKAIDLQPDYAAAWSGLADSLMVGAIDGWEMPREVMPRGEAAARKAVELDDQLAEAHRTMAAMYLFGRWEFDQAERESARAVELDPNSSENHHLRSYVLEVLNRKGEALQEQQKATELDPLTRAFGMGYLLIRLHQYDAALNDTRLRVEAHPDQSWLHHLLTDIYRYKGMDKESAQEFERLLAILGEKDAAESVHRAFARGGLKAVLEWRLDRVTREPKKDYVSPYMVAFFYARLGRKDETLRCLEEAYRQRSPWMVMLQDEPDFDFLHSEPRYQAVVRGMGLPPEF